VEAPLYGCVSAYFRLSASIKGLFDDPTFLMPVFAKLNFLPDSFYPSQFADQGSPRVDPTLSSPTPTTERTTPYYRSTFHPPILHFFLFPFSTFAGVLFSIPHLFSFASQ